MKQSDKLIEVVESFVGIKEDPPGSNKVIFNTMYYGREVSGDSYPWCAVFVWYCFKAVGLGDLFPKTALCQTILDTAKKNNQFIMPPELRAGDVILYKFKTTRNNNAANHVGIIIDSDKNYYYTVEGNTSVTSDDNGGAVMKRKRLRTMPEIVGGYRPKYEEEDTMTGKEIYDALAEYTRTLKVPDWAKAELAEARAAGVTTDTDEQIAGQLVPKYQAVILAYRASKKAGK